MTNIQIVKKCPKCELKLLEKLEPTTGKITIKCPRCRNLVVIDLAFLVRSYPVNAGYKK